MSLFKKIFGDYSSREIKRIIPIQKKVLALEEEYKALTDAQLQAKTPEFKERLKNGETLDDILPEAFAACREASARVGKNGRNRHARSARGEIQAAAGRRFAGRSDASFACGSQAVRHVGVQNQSRQLFSRM